MSSDCRLVLTIGFDLSLEKVGIIQRIPSHLESGAPLLTQNMMS